MADNQYTERMDLIINLLGEINSKFDAIMTAASSKEEPKKTKKNPGLAQ